MFVNEEGRIKLIFLRCSTFPLASQLWKFDIRKYPSIQYFVMEGYNQTKEANSINSIKYQRLDLGMQSTNSKISHIMCVSYFKRVLMVWVKQSSRENFLTFYRLDIITGELRLFCKLSETITQLYGGIISSCLVSDKEVVLVFKSCVCVHRLIDHHDEKIIILNFKTI